jgi:hypothetical protein
LGKTQLAIAAGLIVALPLLLVAWMVFGMTPRPEPRLDAEISLGVTSWSPDGTAERTRLLPALVILNRTKESWGNVSAALNDQFFFYRREKLGPGEEMRVPLEFFATKGNAFFHPPSNDVKEVTLYAQLPSGARGVKEQIIPDSLEQPSKE